MTSDINNNNFTIRDNSSEFAKYLPKKWIEPLTIIARIKDYEGIDDYILQLIRSRLDMFMDSSDTVEWEDFQEYMHNMIKGKDAKNPWVPTPTASSSKSDEKEEEESEENEENEERLYEEIPVNLKLNNPIARLLRIFANSHAKEGGTEWKRIDNFLSEVTKKIVQALAADQSGPAQKPFPDSLKQHVHKLLSKAAEEEGLKPND